MLPERLYVINGDKNIVLTNEEERLKLTVSRAMYFLLFIMTKIP
jgi:hypothetical protein